ncbi:hypothetical protein QYE76_032630 [Lolium multiflorum]|jgi:hypothetical protein|uniref:HMA domain-containing protein n=1 Tax=Lolium multiflorum TaxID=4521 RepID=A0AAD8VII3_LOLMU|nr:hypothetical protein QYE76_032630 [Lolium multiflorum]
MKQQIVIKVQMTGDKCRSKAMSLVAATVGVDSVSLAGDGKDQVVVVGDCIDSVKLTTTLRKKVGHAQLLTVGEAKKPEENKKPAEAAASVVEYTYPYHYYQYRSHTVPVYGYQQYHSRPNTCSIM